MTLSSKLIATFCLLQTAFTPTLCAPPVSELAHAAEEVLQDSVVSTELALGLSPRQPLRRVPTNDDGWLSLAPYRHPSFDEASPSDHSAVSNGAPSLDHLDSGLKGSPSDLQHDIQPLPTLHQPDPIARVPLTPGLDRFVGHSHDGSGPDDYRLLFPSNAEYVASPWFERFWTDAAIHLRNARYHAVFATERARTLLSPSAIREMVLENWKYLQNARVYKFSLPQDFSPSVEPGEVLMRYHTRISLPNQQHYREKVSVWTTADQGRSLAFLGLFHCPSRFFQELVQSARAQAFDVEDHDFRSYVLTPVSTQG
ncbi:hypothetical protein PSEUBRA_004050 [Kalmanozyma brasiliensis GHG001]|uniref:uncharacterized protein n=1 Tax=Kalmanozyma brasiliensis (strain GHG001) TaxID=1365824 RepID=UPI002867E953|nr:uncharacterized protein PSEUBRA_004050 [Kalmanozyma brasiliensis GHG001]KAF6767335.1 hypothetical protein PSEUBRA_004050 [Kalmanozyma brasiliensis GHG001]